MRAIKNRIIVKSNIRQKEEIVYGSLRLVSPNREKYNEDGKRTQPVLAEVIYSAEPSLKEGDIAVLAHNSVNNEALRLFDEGDMRTVVVPVDKYILGKLGEKGELIPVLGNTVVSRMFKPDVSSIIITPDAYKQKEEFKVNVLAVAEDVKDILPGQTAVILQYADYDVFFNVNGEEKAYTIVHESTIVATN